MQICILSNLIRGSLREIFDYIDVVKYFHFCFGCFLPIKNIKGGVCTGASL